MLKFINNIRALSSLNNSKNNIFHYLILANI